MKKFIIFLFGLFICTINAHAELAAEMTCYNGTTCGIDYTHGSGCAAGSAYCLGCPDQVSATTTEGVVSVRTRTARTTCNDTAKTYSCSCIPSMSPKYRCADGYVGECTTPTLASSCTCTKFTCPTGSVCLDTTVTGCLWGYYAKTTYSDTVPVITCYACPENGTCDGETVSCDAGYYKAQAYIITNGMTLKLPGQYICTKCPDGKSSVAGAVGISQCFTPAGTAFTDEIGSGVYTVDCYDE